MKIHSRLLVLPLVPLATLFSLPAMADSISPNINNGDREYSSDKPNSEFYGRGYTGRLTEASALRFEADQLMADAKFEEAKVLLGKAVKLDPGDPEGHIMYARCITKILFAKKTIDEKLLDRCIEEWTIIWHHDSDQIEQAEAKAQARHLMRISKALAKSKKERDKDKALASADKKELD